MAGKGDEKDADKKRRREEHPAVRRIRKPPDKDPGTGKPKGDDKKK